MYLRNLSFIMKFALLLFLLFSCNQNLFSEELLSLDSAVKIALKSNYGITLVRNELNIARNNNTAGNAGFLPRIDATAEYNKSITNAKVSTLANLELDKTGANTELITVGIMLKWTLFDGFNMFANSKYLNILEEIGELNLKIAIESTISNVIIQYFDVVKQMQIFLLLQEQVAISEYRTQIAQLNFDTGMGSEFELLKSKVELNFDKLSLEIQSTNLSNSKISLNELLSRDVTLVFNATDSITIPKILDYNNIKKQMYESNKNLLLSYKNKELSEKEAQKLLSKYYPTIDFKTGYNYYDLNTEATIINKNKYNGFNFGLNANINLYDGMNDSRKHENAKINIINSEVRIKQLENHLDSYLAKFYKEYQDGLHLIELETDNIELAKINMEIAKESFSVGSISSLQFREVQKNLLDANMMLISAKYNIKVKETELLLISGQIIN